MIRFAKTALIEYGEVMYSREEIRLARLKAKIAVRDCRNAENTACYLDGMNDSRGAADRAYDLALEAINNLADMIGERE